MIEPCRRRWQRHWEASDASDFEVEHEIYREDAVLDYPQSGERIRGRRNIQESRFVQPNKKRFAVRRMIGGGDLWVTEFVLTYDGVPSYAVSIMEFRDGLVASETQYFADRFDPAPSRAHSCRAGGLMHVIAARKRYRRLRRRTGFCRRGDPAFLPPDGRSPPSYGHSLDKTGVRAAGRPATFGWHWTERKTPMNSTPDPKETESPSRAPMNGSRTPTSKSSARMNSSRV